MNYILLFLLSILFLNAQALSPTHKLKANGAVTDILKDGDILYASTDNAYIDVFNLKTNTLQYTISFPTIKDFMGDIVRPKVYDIDKLENNNTILAVVQGNRGFSDVYLIIDKIPKLIIKDIKARMMIKRAKFLDENNILLGLLSNELVHYNLKQKKIIYKVQISAYTFSDIVLNKTHTEVITADESGVIHIINTQTGAKIKELEGKNVDNVYQIDYKGSTIICGGKDRRLSIYHRNTTQSYYIKSNFMIYSVGLSPSGNIGAYSANEENDITVFNTNTKQQIATLTASKTIITRILFTSETDIITASDDCNILFWKIK